jgi:hypothetical protein
MCRNEALWSGIYQSKVVPCSEVSVRRFLALFAVVFVLVTPAPDELPCTAPHGKLPVVTLPAAVLSIGR